MLLKKGKEQKPTLLHQLVGKRSSVFSFCCVICVAGLVYAFLLRQLLFYGAADSSRLTIYGESSLVSPKGKFVRLADQNVRKTEARKRSSLNPFSIEGLQTNNNSQVSHIGFIQDVVMEPDEILFLVRRGVQILLSNSEMESSCFRCSFSRKLQTKVIDLEEMQGGDRLAFRCAPPPPSQRVSWTAKSVAITVAAHGCASVGNTSKSWKIESRTEYTEPMRWTWMVYEAVAGEQDVVVMAKGVNRRQLSDVNPARLRCVFGDTVETDVTSSAQEVFRCRHPPNHLRKTLIGSKLTLRLLTPEGTSLLLPSAAYYNPPPKPPSQESPDSKLLCVCTMVMNVKKFIKEWVMYNTHIGAQTIIIYDNNSEDGLRTYLRTNAAAIGNVVRRPWPWAKTQEAGLSHCALLAEKHHNCSWMMFTDVDEFPFGETWSAREGALRAMVSGAAANVGQIIMNCRNFGPSGRREHPVEGITQGYTCRERGELRHKSIVRTEAVSASLRNVVHHFELQKGWKSVRWRSRKVVVNHYKYQVWDEFVATRFRRRVSAFVADWQDRRNQASKDRAPGLGVAAVKPKGWETMFCQVNDTRLRDYVRRVFSDLPWHPQRHAER